jgi:hypothetical protein
VLDTVHNSDIEKAAVTFLKPEVTVTGILVPPPAAASAQTATKQ